VTNFSKFAPFLVLVVLAWPHPSSAQRAQYESMVAAHAQANGVPVELVHRVIVRESRYNPRAVHRGNYGMMQIKLATARGLGYTGTAEGLLDPETNLTYAVKYLAGAYRAAHGNHNRAVAYYAGGYYYVAKRQRLHDARHEAMSANAQALGAPLFIAPR
jgi:soluble lytic murein transglycosylase-like protein